MPRHTTTGATLATVAALALAACGGGSSGSSISSGSSGSGSGSGSSISSSSSAGSSSNGIPDQSADQIVSQATQAIDGVHTVHVSGDVGAAKSTIHLDLHLVDGTGATGSMSENGLSFKLITVGNYAYINGSSGFWKQFGGSAAVQLMQGRWLKAPSHTGQFASFSSLTNLHKLLSALLSGHGALTKGSTSTVDGQSVIAINDRSNGGTLYVATTGKPYPVRISGGSGSGGRGSLDFDDFDQTVTVKAPASSIDITKLKKG